MSLEGKSEDDIRVLERQLIARLDELGGFAGNISLLRALQWQEDTYWSVRDRLVNAGELELGRGKGGSVRHVAAAEVHAPVRIAEVGALPEEELYEPIARVLREHWVKDSRYRQSIVEITARQGKRDTGGKWSRPDISVVGMTTYVFVPGKHFDVATFEIKPYSGIDVAAVYEALAHRRAATRAYVVLHVPPAHANTPGLESLLESLCDEAKRHGVGVLVIADPQEYATWDERVEATRVEPAPERLNDFIAIQLSDGAKNEIVQWFR